MLSAVLVLVGDLDLGVVVHDAAPGDLLEIGEGDILLHVLDEDEAVPLAILGRVGDAGLYGVLGMPQARVSGPSR